MVFVGIDVSKYKHDCFVISSEGEVLHQNVTFINDIEGFSSFLALLNGLGEKENIKIGLEATGHYGLNLKLFLEKAGYSFMEVNPVLVSKFIKSQTLRKTKTDNLDAFAIARYMTTVEYKPYPKSFYHNYSLKSLTRLRDVLVRRRSDYLVRLTNVLDHIFPEFKPLFKNRFSVTALYILANYPSPLNIANMNSRSYDILRKKSHGKFKISDFVRLKELALNTVGESNHILLLEQDTLIDLYTQLDSKIDVLDKEITKLVEEMNSPICSVVGIGTTSAAVILSEFGDFSRFSSPSKMLSFAGLEPGYFQSGTSEHTGKMVKRGSSQLRYTIMNCCLPLINHNMVFAEYYNKKRNEGKAHRVALSHVAKKLIRVIFTLQTQNIQFDPEKLR